MNLPDNAKIWIFQANRDFSLEEKKEIEGALSHFLKSWKAHGADLSSDFSLPYNRFIVVGVDENQVQATGCSIDKLTHLIKIFDQKFNLDLLNRMLVSMYEDNRVTSLSLKEFRERLKNNQISDNVEIFNTSINNFFDFKSKFIVPVEDSWVARMRMMLN